VIYLSVFHMYLIPLGLKIGRKSAEHTQIEQSENPVGENTIGVVLKEYSIYRFIAGWFCAIVVILTIGCSRVYLGVHSLDQILLGWIYGTATMFFIFNFTDQHYDKYLNYLALKPWKSSLTPMLPLGIAGLILLITPVIAYAIQNQIVTYNPIWIANLNSKCQVTTPFILLPLNFTKCGISMVVFGILFGIICTKGEYQASSNQRLSWGKEIWRVIIMLLTLAIPYLALEFIPETINYYLTYFVQSSLKYFLLAFCWMCLSPYLLYISKCDKDGDWLRYVPGTKVNENFQLPICQEQKEEDKKMNDN